MISRRFFLVLVSTLLLSSCIKSPLIDRTFYNYFPYEVGKTWTYLMNDSDTVQISIVGDTLLGTDTVLIFENYDGTRNYIFSTSSAYYTIEDTAVVGPNGEEVRLEDQIFILQMEKPLVSGSSWDDYYYNFETVGEDTFWIRHSRIGEVTGLTTITTPGGTFENTYHVRLIERKTIGGPNGVGIISSVRNLYFAPDIGPVKELTTINIHDSTEDSVTDTTYTVKLELLR